MIKLHTHINKTNQQNIYFANQSIKTWIFVFLLHCLKHVQSLMNGLRLLVTQRGLSLTEDLAVSSPMVPKHRRVGAEEGEIQRHIESRMERERQREREPKREKHSEQEKEEEEEEAKGL